MFKFKILAAAAAIAVAAGLPLVAEAANGSWTLIKTDTLAKEKTYGISGTTDLSTPPLDPAVKNSAIDVVVSIASSSVVVTPTAVIVSGTYGGVNNPSGTIAGAPTLKATATAGGAERVTDKFKYPRVGLTVDVSDAGAGWSAYVRVKEPQ